MTIITDNIQWIMLAAGVLTLSLLQAAFAPRAAMRSMFGETPDGPGLTIVVRTWGFVICTTAAFPLYAAFIEPAYRVPAVAIAAAGKLYFVALTFAVRPKGGALVAATIDSVFVLLFALYLFAQLQG